LSAEVGAVAIFATIEASVPTEVSETTRGIETGAVGLTPQCSTTRKTHACAGVSTQIAGITSLITLRERVAADYDWIVLVIGRIVLVGWVILIAGVRLIIGRIVEVVGRIVEIIRGVIRIVGIVGIVCRIVRIV
jgi:hypothetical protein